MAHRCAAVHGCHCGGPWLIPASGKQLDSDRGSARRPRVGEHRAPSRSAAAWSRFLPQTHEPGGETALHFADLELIPWGVTTKTFLFTLRLSHSGKSVRRALIELDGTSVACRK